MVVKVKETYEKTIQFYTEKEMSGIMIEFYLIRRNLVVSHDLIIIP